MRTSGVLLVTMCAALYALTTAMSKLFFSVYEFSILTYSFIAAAPGVTILPFKVADGSIKRIKPFIKWALAPAFLFGSARILFYYAVNYGSPSLPAVVNSFSPIMVAVLSFFVFAERLNRHQIAGMVVAILGMLIFHASNFQTNTGNLLAEAAAVLSMLGFSVNNVATKKALENVDEATLTTLIFTISSAVLAPVAISELAAKISFPFMGRAPLTPIILAGIFLFAFLTVILPTYLLIDGLNYVSPTTAGLLLLSQPIFTMIFASALRVEYVAPLQVIGAIITILGIAIFRIKAPEKEEPSLKELRKEKEKPSPKNSSKQQ
ncbi:MAG: DMT family transporter [Candidatus Jordarchaeales archaeon]|nr:DMT family transporter [Candidatus Jordarchaeia archaeon]